MNYNIIGYLIYAPITVFITVYVGGQCHKHGLIYVKSAITDKNVAIAINNLLLVGYYLVNIGYAIIGLRNWEYISNPATMISSISSHTGTIILLLALLHFTNISGLALVRKLNKSIHINN